ncbi:unnamed protein product [Lactuca saligna]|uniref:DUF4283 domain-containing protein n=1 Tax=Lactuca saligna TaxID=75948 RepID=A0AA35YBJ2_LACSI|nr:unnamed protein product [Lactuca saligna]
MQMSPITINLATVMNEWLKKSVLIGEAHNLDHIVNLPTSLLMNEGTKYLGGLNIALHFDKSAEVLEFLNVSTSWRDGFNRLVRADQHEIPYERTAWLKILGLPLRLWDDENFNIIVGRFGRIVSPFNKLYTRHDYSMGKACKIGVVESSDDWSPFLPAPFDKADEDSDEDEKDDVDDSRENDEEEDVISDTWMGDQNDDTKKGEIRSELSQSNNPARHESDVGGWTDNRLFWTLPMFEPKYCWLIC